MSHKRVDFLELEIYLANTLALGTCTEILTRAAIACLHRIVHKNKTL
jgi:hypothetical protein